MWAADSWAEAEEVARAIEEAVYGFIESEGCMPVGATIPYAGATAPDGWLMCDGAQYARVDYPLLYAALDSVFIVDANSFTVPDLDGRFIAGAGSAYLVGDTGGADDVTLTVNEMPAHTHQYDKPTFNVDVETVGVPDPTGVGEPQLSTSTSSTGGGDAHENRPPFTALNVIIKAR
jgi:microcystin-dependent protein